MTSVDATGLEMKLYRADYLDLRLAGTCPAQVVQQPDGGEFRFRLDRNGDAKVYLTGITVGYDVLTTCIQTALPSQSCTDLNLSGGDCTSESCGICSCREQLDSISDEYASWSSSGTTLTVGPRSFEYCVQGTTLQLRDSGTGMQFVMQRVYTMGNCRLSDYGSVAGCSLLVTPPSCVGTPAPCSTQPNALWCNAVPGCTAGTSCIGGSHACQDYDDMPSCTCDGYGRCSGSYTCERLDSSTCELSSLCRWDSDACLGTPTPCAQLVPEECELMDGCALQAPAP